MSMHNTPPAVAWELLVKHLYSIRRMVSEFEATGMPPTTALTDEKIGDAINYLVLIEALFKRVSID